jgi:hypothetical protein
MFHNGKVKSLRANTGQAPLGSGTAWLRLLHVRREAIYHLISMIKSARRGFDELNAQNKRRN